MKIMLFSSQIFNTLNYAEFFSHLDQKFIIAPLIPSGGKKEYENKITCSGGMKQKNIEIFPIFLKTPDSRFRNLLNPFILVRDFFSIFKALKYHNPDAIICFFVLDAYPLVMLKRIFKYSLSVAATGGDVNLHVGVLYSLLRKFIYRNSDLVFAVSNELKDKIQIESGHEAIVIPTCVDPSFFKPLNLRGVLRKKWGLRQEDFVVITVCNLVKHKGVDVIIRSISMLKDRHRYKVKLLIVGDGPERYSLKDLGLKLGLNQDISFLGLKSRRELTELYNLADIFVLASYSEGLPFSLLEAMACGCVCISSNVGDIPRVIRDGYNGFLLFPGDPVDLEKKVEKILSLSKEQFSAIQSTARTTVMNNFDSRELMRTMIDLIVSRNVSQ